MKIAVILGAYSIGSRPLNFTDIWNAPRGLTGTDLSTCMVASELAKLGHEISLFTVHDKTQPKPEMWQGVRLYNFEERFAVIDDTFNAIISINEPDVFRGMTTTATKICWQFLNDFTYCQPGFDELVDLWFGVCEMHVEHLKKLAPSPEKWRVVSLGTDLSWRQNIEKIPGRMIFCSSPDRGLHNALQIFPEIKKKVPNASLKIFYHFQDGEILKIEPTSRVDHPHVIEMSNRLRYCKDAIKRLKGFGVEHVGSVSANELRKEMSQAELLLFPTSTVAFSEGFSLSVLQSHISGAIPAIASTDCLGSIYRNSGCIMMDAPVENKLKEYTSGVIRALTDKVYANEVREKCFEFSKQFLWADIAKKIEKILVQGERK